MQGIYIKQSTVIIHSCSTLCVCLYIIQNDEDKVNNLLIIKRVFLNYIYIYASVSQYDQHLHSVCDKPYFVDGIRDGWEGRTPETSDRSSQSLGGGGEMSDRSSSKQKFGASNLCI